MSNLLQKASIITTPTAYDTGKILSVKPVQYYGPELVTNGDFESNVNNWGTDSGATITWQSDQTALVTSTADSTFAIVQSNVLTVNRKYKVSLKFKPNNTGVFRVRLGGSLVTFSTSVFNTNEWNNIEFIGIADNTTLEIGSSGGSITNFYIDNVSIKEVFNADFDFTRNSSATRVGSNGLIQDVASNLPRIDYTGGVGSWKFEPQSINVLPYSENFSHSSWVKNDVTIQSGYIAPDGTNSAYKVTKIGSNAHLVNTTTGGNTATKSIFAKTTSGTGTIILFNNVTTYFTITEEWQRFDIQHNGLDFFYAADFRGASTLTEIIIWGAQSEALSYPTSYIRSNIGSATTRLADVANNAGSSDLINSTEGVLYAEISALADDGTFRRISLADGTNNNRILLGFGDDNNISAVLLSGGGLQSNLNSSIDILNNNKVAFLYKENNFELWINGFQISTDNSGITFSNNTLNVLDFKNSAGGFDFYGNTKSVAVFKEALTDLELECLVSWMSFSDLGINFGYTVE